MFLLLPELRRYGEHYADCLLYSAAWALRDGMVYVGLMGVLKLAETAAMAAENLNAQVASSTAAEILQAPIAFAIVNTTAARRRCCRCWAWRGKARDVRTTTDASQVGLGM